LKKSRKLDFSRFDKRLVTILSIVFVQMVGAAMILPILPLFAERTFSLKPSLVTLLVSSYFAAQFFAGPYLGQLSDRRGRLPILIFSQIGSAVSFFMMAAAGAAWMLFAARIVDGITGGNIIVAQAYITDVTPREKRTEALGYIMAVFGIGFIIGPALGGLLSAWFGPRVPFVIAALASLATALMIQLFLDETVTEDTKAASLTKRRVSLSVSDVLANLPLGLILLSAFIGQFGMGMLQSTFALFGDAVIFAGASDQTANLGIGMLLALVGIGQFITQTRLIGPAKRRFGDALLVIIGASLRAVSFILFALSTTVWPAGSAALLFAVGMGLMMPPLQSLATRTVDDHIRGAVLGVYQSSISLATIFSTAIAGVIFSLRPALPYWVGAGLTLLVIPPAYVILQKSRNNSLLPKEQPNPTD
jgi:DHA1 family tetracycline resistance protein-like MFS transporter